VKRGNGVDEVFERAAKAERMLRTCVKEEGGNRREPLASGYSETKKLASFSSAFFQSI